MEKLPLSSRSFSQYVPGKRVIATVSAGIASLALASALAPREDSTTTPRSTPARKMTSRSYSPVPPVKRAEEVADPVEITFTREEPAPEHPPKKPKTVWDLKDGEIPLGTPVNVYIDDEEAERGTRLITVQISGDVLTFDGHDCKLLVRSLFGDKKARVTKIEKKGDVLIIAAEGSLNVSGTATWDAETLKKHATEMVQGEDSSYFRVQLSYRKGKAKLQRLPKKDFAKNEVAKSEE